MKKRKQYMTDKLTQELSKLDNKVRFILAVVNEELVIRKVKKAAILAELDKQKYIRFPKKSQNS